MGRLLVVKRASGYIGGRLRLSQHWMMRMRAEMAHRTRALGVDKKLLFTLVFIFLLAPVNGGSDDVREVCKSM